MRGSDTVGGFRDGIVGGNQPNVMSHNGYRGLKVWTKAMDFVVRVHESTEMWPRTQQFGLTSQVTRAAVGVASNIAEGHGRFTGGGSRLPATRTSAPPPDPAV